MIIAESYFILRARACQVCGLDMVLVGGWQIFEVFHRVPLYPSVCAMIFLFS